MATGMNLTLAANAVYSTMSNMCLNLRVDPHDLGDFGKYYSMFRKDVEPYAQYFRIINTDATTTYAFTGDTNILSTTYPPCTEDKVELDKFRQIEVSYEHFRSKAMGGSANIFSDFVSSVTQWVEDTFKLFMGATVNVFLGVTCKLDTTSGKPAANKAVQTVTIPALSGNPMEKEASVRVAAGVIADKVQQILDEMKDARRDYNDLGYVRTTPSPVIIWNDKVVRKLLKKGLQGNTLYQTPDFNFENTMPERFFGVGSGSTSSGTGKNYRSLVEQTISNKHYMPGDLLADSLTGLTAADNYQASVEGADLASDDIVCVICDSEYPIILHGETADTSFENPKAHINTAWKTWSYGLGQDKGKAFVRVKLSVSASNDSLNAVITNTTSAPVNTKEVE